MPEVAVNTDPTVVVPVIAALAIVGTVPATAVEAPEVAAALPTELVAVATTLMNLL